MKLLRLYAYAVEPSRLEGEPVLTGGRLSPGSDLRGALEEASRPMEQIGIPIAFEVNPQTRTHEVRDHFIDFAFKPAAKAEAAARNLAVRLSRSMDGRSGASLLILAGYGEEEKRRLHMWTFPSEEAFAFKAKQKQADVALLPNVFSRKSRMQKGARFEGRNDRASFLEGRALDYQATFTSKQLADFWIVRFLSAKLSLAAGAGTRMLAACLRRAYDNSRGADERDELYRAAIALRASRTTRWSLSQFASQYLSEETAATFLAGAPNAESRDALFDLDGAEFESKIDTRIFKLEGGVMVSAPFATMGSTVRVEGDEHKILKCEGTIVQERLRKRARGTTTR